MDQSSPCQISQLRDSEPEPPSKDTDLRMLLKLTIMSTMAYFMAITTLFTAASLPGSHIYAHMVLGIAEGVSAGFSGLLCKYVKAQNLFIFF